MTSPSTTSSDAVLAAVRARYGARAATQAELPLAESCCGADSGCCSPQATGVNSFSADLYDLDQMDELPLKAALARLGCANPTAVATLNPGDVVLDLGSGGGIDALLAARRVGPTGHVYGIDVTDEMLALAWQNAAEAGLGNVSFLKGDIESLPVPDTSVDVIISNCVINLAADKRRVLAEAHRVLVPSGRLAVADVVIRGGLPEGSPFADALRQDLTAWSSCVAGALGDGEYTRLLHEAGFADVAVEVVRDHTAADLFPQGLPAYAGLEPPDVVDAILARFASAVIRARKP
jgi:arsenite methyltransferase